MKKKKTSQLRLRLPRRDAQDTDETLGWRAETEISVRPAHGDTTSALFYNPRTVVKIGGSRIRPWSSGECDTRKRVFSLR
jgi:hypothetical protein